MFQGRVRVIRQVGGRGRRRQGLDSTVMPDPSMGSVEQLETAVVCTSEIGCTTLNRPIVTAAALAERPQCKGFPNVRKRPQCKEKVSIVQQ